VRKDALLLLFVTLGAGPVLWAESPSALLSEIAVRGAAPVVHELYDSPSWNGVMEHVAKGERDWLLAAAALRRGTDAATTEELDLAVSTALIPNAKDVFDVFMEQIPARAICYGAAESAGHETLEKALNELHAKIAGVKKVNDPRLAKYKAECLKLLREDEPGLRQIYQSRSTH
jgi:hypothetical protein